MNDLVIEVEKLMDDAYYKEYSDFIKEKSKNYHISHIGQLYKNLC